jgi:hypothetical protein
MILRWVSAALAEAEQKFRRLRGHRDIARLVAALDRLRRESQHTSMVA